jgi:DNA-binding response OmpR family regulator
MTKVLIVEDEALVAFEMEAALRREGFEIAACIGSVEQALVFLRSGDCDVGVLDANVRGASIGPVAAALEERGRPFVFVSGYERAQLPGQFPDAPVLSKPHRSRELVGVVRELSARGASGLRPVVVDR